MIDKCLLISVKVKNKINMSTPNQQIKSTKSLGWLSLLQKLKGELVKYILFYM